MQQRFPPPARRGLFTSSSIFKWALQLHIHNYTNLSLPWKRSTPVSLIEKKKKKRRQLLGGKCEVIYHGCGWRRGRWRGGGKESSPGTPPVAALILSRSRLGWDNKTFTAIDWVSHSGLFLMPGLSRALQIQWEGPGCGCLRCSTQAYSSWAPTAVTHRNDCDLLTHLCWIVVFARLLALPFWKLLRDVRLCSTTGWVTCLALTGFIFLERIGYFR